MTADPLYAISPLDGRYHADLEPLRAHCSEFALMRGKLRVEIEYFIALTAYPGVDFLRPLTEAEIAWLRGLVTNFDAPEAACLKQIEADIRHDTKAVELYLAEQFAGTSLAGLAPGLHFALTSEDVTNLALALNVREAMTAVLLPALADVIDSLRALAAEHAALPLLARTHGQPASPTTLGKELAIYAARLARADADLVALVDGLAGKLNGATGNFNAHVAAYPGVDWLAFSRAFVRGLGLTPTDLTTQVEPGDTLAALFDGLARANTMLTDLCRDVWRYISDGVFKQRVVAGEVGSSTMPHKVNPIQFENAEGNLALATALLTLLARRLPVSRLQRDLSNSTVQRNIGVALGHTLLAYQNVRRGLGRIAPDADRLRAQLDAHWEVLAEAAQTILRREGVPDAYERLKDFSRGGVLTRADLAAFIDGLAVSPAVKAELRALTPTGYTGLAEQLALLPEAPDAS